MVNKKLIVDSKKKLLKLKKQYCEILNRPMSGMRKSIDLIDLARNEEQIHTSAYFRNQMAQKVKMIDAALEAIKDGSYGICKITGAPISEKRLKAVPWSLTSIGHMG